MCVLKYVVVSNGNIKNVQIVSQLSQFTPGSGTLLTIGVFDGVHLGHQHLIERLTQQAAASNLLSGVVTFNRHPRVVLSPHVKLARLTTLEERISLLKALGIGIVVPLTFTKELAALSAREFVTVLKQHLQMQGLVVGPNFAVGSGREGDVAFLKTLGNELGFTLDVVEPLTKDGSLVSSTAVREALSRGDMKKTGELLGRYFRLSGTVGSGKERGHVLGFPTANIILDPDHALPIDGVYATVSHIGGKTFKSVTNIGMRPTFGEGERTVEVFLIDFSGDIYGQELAIEIVERLRGELKFDGPEQLAAQITKDVERAMTILG